MSYGHAPLKRPTDLSKDLFPSKAKALEILTVRDYKKFPVLTRSRQDSNSAYERRTSMNVGTTFTKYAVYALNRKKYVKQRSV